MLLLLACNATWSRLDSDPVLSPPPVDLTEVLGRTGTRAGRVDDESVLIGGISAEGKAGDFLIYNDRVRFVIQDVGDSSFYVDYGGQIIDADLVRAAGEPGRDLLDELGPMIGLGRVTEPTAVTVISDGTDAPAQIRVEGDAKPLRLLTGALESDSIIPEYDLHIVTDYTLRPGSWAVEVTTTVTNNDSVDFEGAPGMFGVYAQEVAERWAPGEGRDPEAEQPTPWTGIQAHHNEVAVALLARDGEMIEQGTIASLLGSMAAALVGFGPTATVPPGGSTAWTVDVGVGPDLATLSGEQLQKQGVGGQMVSGMITAGGAPLAGARATVLDTSGSPITVATTDTTGTWRAIIPNAPYQVFASGRGPGRFLDLPAGHAWISPYDVGGTAAMATLSTGAVATPHAEGYGFVGPTTLRDIDLTRPATVSVHVADGGPAVVRLYFANGDPVVADERLVPGREDGAAAVGWVRDGDLDLTVEPGDYTLIAHRGVRDEVDVQSIHVASGDTLRVDVDVPAAYTLDGVIVGDPHVHAAPSGDASVPMEDRLLTMAANGVDVHFGTDHDHIADYNPLIPAMGLESRLKTVVADEVSPVLRGHFNMYPASAGDGANHGAPRWWFGYENTCEIFGWMREEVGADGIIQANHPVSSSGMFSFAAYDPNNGVIEDADHWCDDFQAMELNNSGDWEDYFPYYLDLAKRGAAVTPVGVSDTHSYSSGGLGMNVTFLHTGGTFGSFGDAELVTTMRARETVVSKGPYIHATVDGDWAPGRELVGPITLDVQIKAPSWMPVDTLTLYQDGVVLETYACVGAAPTPCDTSWLLAPEADTTYVVVASSTQPMLYAHAGSYAWAATSAIRVDADGSGWSSTFPGLVVE